MSTEEKVAQEGTSRLLIVFVLSIITSILSYTLTNDFLIAFSAWSWSFILFLWIGAKIVRLTASKEEREIIDRNLNDFNSKINEYTELKKMNQNIEYVKYISGYHDYTEVNVKGTLFIIEDNIVFYKTSNRITGEVAFKVPIKQIKNIVYDLAEQITLGRALLFGVLSFAFKKKTYYLVIEYSTNKGVNNQLVIETGAKKNLEFMNSLNIVRNKLFEENSDSTNNIINQIKMMSELKEANILSEKEFIEKKEELLKKLLEEDKKY